jgi:type II secretory pathway pseudopilin PulG
MRTNPAFCATKAAGGLAKTAKPPAAKGGVAVRKQRRAYTLLEVTLVCVVLVVVAGISLPLMSSMYTTHKLRAATDTVRAGWASARTRAIEDGRSYRFSVVAGKGNFRIAPDNPAYWSGGAPPSEDNNPAMLMEDALPKGISFAIGNSGGGGNPKADTILPPGSVQPNQYATVAVFEPDGTAHDPNGQDDLTITFDLPGARAQVLSLRGMTATSTVRQADR